MPNPRRVVVLAYAGLCTFEFGCAVEVFGLARPELGPDWYRFAVAGIEPGPFHATGGITLATGGGLELLATADIVIVPGWRGVDAAVPEPLIAALRAAFARGAEITSLCSGAFVLGEAGLLDGRDATTHWRYRDAFVARFPAARFVPDVLYVDAGRVLTAAGSAAGLDLCLHMVRRDHGARAANAVARGLVLPAHRAGGQAQFVERPVARLRGADAGFAAFLDRVRAALHEPWPIARMAAEAATSRRGLHRRFQEMAATTPGAWLAEARIEAARALLETSGASPDDIADACGFQTAATLRHHVRARLGTTPTAYRASFNNRDQRA